MNPNPTALRSLVKHEDVDNHRSLSWRSWSCARCKLFLFTRELLAAETAHEATLRVGFPAVW